MEVEKTIKIVNEQKVKKRIISNIIHQMEIGDYSSVLHYITYGDDSDYEHRVFTREEWYLNFPCFENDAKLGKFKSIFDEGGLLCESEVRELNEFSDEELKLIEDHTVCIVADGEDGGKKKYYSGAEFKKIIPTITFMNEQLKCKEFKNLTVNSTTPFMISNPVQRYCEDSYMKYKRLCKSICRVELNGLDGFDKKLVLSEKDYIEIDKYLRANDKTIMIPGLLFPFLNCEIMEFGTKRDEDARRNAKRIISISLEAFSEMDMDKDNSKVKALFELLANRYIPDIVTLGGSLVQNPFPWYYLSPEEKKTIFGSQDNNKDAVYDRSKVDYNAQLLNMKNEIIALSKISRKMNQCIDWSARSNRHTSNTFKLPSNIANYEYRRMVACIPYFLYMIDEKYKAQEYIIHESYVMDHVSRYEDWYLEVLKRLILETEGLYEFTLLTAEYDRLTLGAEPIAKDGVAGVCRLFKNIIEESKKEWKKHQHLEEFNGKTSIGFRFKDRYDLLLGDLSLSDDSVKGELSKTLKYPSTSLTEFISVLDDILTNKREIYLSDVEQMKRWLLFFCLFPGDQLPNELLYKGRFSIGRVLDKEKTDIIENTLPIIKCYAEISSDKLGLDEVSLKFEEKRQSLLVVELKKSIIEFEALKINESEELTEEDINKINGLLNTKNELLQKYSNTWLKRNVKLLIEKDMKQYCREYLGQREGEEENLFERINVANRDDVYKQIFSGLLYFENLKNMNQDQAEQQIDYAGVIVQMTRSVEALLKYIYQEMKNNGFDASDILTYDSNFYVSRNSLKSDLEMGPLSRLFQKKSFPSGDSSYVLKFGQGVLDVGKVRNIAKTITTKDKRGNAICFSANDGTTDIFTISDNIYKALDCVTQNYRNESAHAGRIKECSDVDKCREVLMETENILWLLLTALV